MPNRAACVIVTFAARFAFRPSAIDARALGQSESVCAADERERNADYIVSTARVAELVDALDLGSSGAIRGGSSPPFRISFHSNVLQGRDLLLLVRVQAHRDDAPVDRPDDRIPVLSLQADLGPASR